MSAAGADPGLPSGLRLLAEGALDHCENVAWDPATGGAVAGGEAGQLYRVGLDGSVQEVTRIDGAFLLGIAIDRDGAILACDARKGHVHRIGPDGRSEPFGPPLRSPNYPALAADGTLYVSLEGSHRGGDGGIVAIDPSGTARAVPLGRPLDFGNALLVEGDDLIVVESDGPRVSRVPRDGGDLEGLVELPGTVPDGLARDADGGLWISCYQPNRILRLAPDGSLATVADDVLGWHLPMPTGICFGGPDLRTLLVACLGGWSLAAIDSPVPGLLPERLRDGSQGEGP